jgi:hypothetical protein
MRITFKHFPINKQKTERKKKVGQWQHYKWRHLHLQWWKWQWRHLQQGLTQQNILNK